MEGYVIFYYTNVAQEIVKAVRGKRSQAFVNKRLGLSFNQVAKWETGRKRILWTDFIAICQICHCDLTKPLSEVLKFNGDISDFGSLVHRLVGNARMSEVSMHCGSSRFTIGRWYGGKICPDLCAILSLIDSFQSLLSEFVAALVPIEKVPCLLQEYRRREKQKRLIYTYPEIGGVLRALELKKYIAMPKHETGFIAAQLGLSKKREKFLLRKMEDVGLIEYEEKKYRVKTKRLDLKGDFEGVQRVKSFWSKKGLKVLETFPANVPQDDKAFAFRLFSISATAKKQLFTKLHEFYDSVKLIITKDDEVPESILVLNVHLFTPSASPDRKSSSHDDDRN